VPVYLSLITGVPFALAIVPIRVASTGLAMLLAWVAAAGIFCTAYVSVAGILSRLTLGSIVAGRFPRDLGHEIYGRRRLYALCWTSIYYCSPVYHAVLAVPFLKHLTLRLFGYRGSLDFQTYPDTWLRDLPLLEIGSGAYLSNKATVSPNMCLRNGKIIVMPVRIGAGSMIGHLTMIAPGVEIGANSEVGVGASVGVRARIGSGSHVDHIATIDHQAVIGDRCVIGIRAYIGRKAVIADRIHVPPGAIVPAGARIETQAHADMLIGESARESAETRALALS
jgi:carbonic anhydrase/acetyltransferase-like protein (isoleucine patch superfamily)